MGEHTWSFPSSGRLRGVRVWVKWNFVNVERRVVQQACTWVAFKSSSLESELLVRRNNFFEHGSYFGARMHRVPFETTTKEIDVSAGRENAFGEIDAKIVISKFFHYNIHVTRAFFKRVCDHNEIIQIHFSYDPYYLRTKEFNHRVLEKWTGAGKALNEFAPLKGASRSDRNCPLSRFWMNLEIMITVL